MGAGMDDIYLEMINHFVLAEFDDTEGILEIIACEWARMLLR